MRNRLRYFVVFLLVLCAGHVPWSNTARAQEERTGFALSTDSQVLSGRRGSTEESSITIVTHGADKVTRYEISLMDLGQTIAGSTQPMEVGRGARSCARWISIQETVEIPPGASRTIPFTITIPSDARGGYYAYIVVRHIVDRPDAGRFVLLVQPTLSVKIELEVPGRNTVQLGVTDLSFSHDLENGLPGLTVEVKNEGDVKASLEGDIILYSQWRAFPVRTQIPADPSGRPHTIYPGLSRRLNCLLTETPRSGDYRAEVRLLMAGRWRTKSAFDITIPKLGSRAAHAEFAGRSEFDIDFDVHPNFVEVILPPRATRTVSVRAHNHDTLAVQARASVQEVVQESSGFLTYGDIADSSERWVKVSPSEFTLEPRSTKNLLLNITAPETESGTAALCAVRILATGGIDETNWLSEADLGVPIIAVPPGASPADIVISELEVIRPSSDRNPTAAIMVARNSGGRTAILEGKLVIERASNGQLIQTMNISRMAGLILPPGVEREFRMPLAYLDKDRFRLRAEVAVSGKRETEKRAAINFTCLYGPD